MKVFTRILTVVLILVIGGLLFLRFSPNYSMFLVQSNSMKGVFSAGDAVVIGPPGGPFGGTIKAGTIITFQHQGQLVTHRIISVKGDALQTQGDAVADPDPWTVSRSDVRGVYLFRLPGIGNVQSFIHTRTGWLIVVIVPSGLLVGLLAREIQKKKRESQDSAP